MTSNLFEFIFIQRAFFVGTIIAILAPIIGIFLVVRRFSQLSDTLSHVSLVGIAIGFLLESNPLIYAIITSVLASLGIEKVRQTQKTFNESILVLFITGGLGLASVLISFSNNFGVNLYSYLFGSLATVTESDQNLIVLVGLVVVIIFIFYFKKFFLLSFDEEIAQTTGLNTKYLNYLMMICAALIISISIRIIGVLLVSSLMIIPVITAIQLKLSFKSTLITSIIFSIISVWAGLLASYYFNLATGGVIALINTLFFITIFIWQKLG